MGLFISGSKLRKIMRFSLTVFFISYYEISKMMKCSFLEHYAGSFSFSTVSSWFIQIEALGM